MKLSKLIGVMGAGLLLMAAPASAEEPAWSGLYGGAHLGYAWGDWDADLSHSSGAIHYSDPFNPADNVLSVGDNWLGGFQLGWNRQSGSLVWGLEADVSWTGMDASGRYQTANNPICGNNPCTQWDIETSLDLLGTVRGRLGYLATPNLLLYGTGGLAWGMVDAKQAANHNAPDFLTPGGRTSGDVNHFGWAAGAGGEYLLASNLTIKAEWLYVDLGKENYALNGTTTPGGTIPYTETFATDLSFHTVRIGVNYRFGQ